MSNHYLAVNGKVISNEELQIPKAQDVAKAIKEIRFAHLVECRRTESGTEIIVFDAEVELGQIKIHDIRRFERISIEFDPTDSFPPLIFALRPDFPKVPHLNIRVEELPRSLCVFEEEFSELKLYWTGTFFVERIREWLALTAKGKLHAEDQPLEPLLLGSEWQLILPSDLFTKGFASELLTIHDLVDSGNNRKTLIAKRATNREEQQNSIKYVATLIYSEPQTHGTIYAVPQNMFELHEFLRNGNIDLLDLLRRVLDQWRVNNAYVLNAGLILIIVLPKTREPNGSPEAQEIRAFLIDSPIKKIGVEIGIWGDVDGEIGKLIGIDETKNGQQLSVRLLNPLFSFSKHSAAQLSGLPKRLGKKIVAVGLGALGSQVFLNLIRMGCGEWVLIDKDFLLPHNLGRHALTGIFVGHPKATSLALVANFMVDDGPIAEGIVADILNPTDREKTKSALDKADIILDTSTSVAVARYLVHDVDSPARRVSMFLNPLGTDVVILAEDEKREVLLDLLEMQYYRHLINESSLNDHLQQNQERIRYANSCRDVSNTTPQDLVALHAAICSRALRKITSTEDAVISIWRADVDELTAQKLSFPIAKPIKFKIGEWLLCTDEWMIDKIYQARADKLPNETGGVLIGSYDMQRKIVYVVDTILSPPDSQEWPTVYIRGFRGLKQGLDQVGNITMQQLKYVGEWHSHPDGYGCNPSQDDYQAFCWLADIMSADGLPPLMLITGEHSQYGFYLGQMTSSKAK